MPVDLEPGLHVQVGQLDEAADLDHPFRRRSVDGKPQLAEPPAEQRSHAEPDQRRHAAIDDRQVGAHNPR